MINVLVVEDSIVALELIVRILSADPDILIVGTAGNGEMAIEAVRRLRPDVITMDIHMPKMDGIEATRRIMETVPTPIVILSGSSDQHEALTMFRAMAAGALTALARPVGIGHAGHAHAARELLQTVKLMSEVKVVRRWPQVRNVTAADVLPKRQPRVPETIKVIAIGASIGGPLVLRKILGMLPQELPVPVLIVQHMATGFIQSFAEWLAQASRLPVHVGAHGERVKPGHVYLAPSEFQMKIERGGIIALSDEMPESGLRPSVAFLFRSLAEVYDGDVIAGLLTGMGSDGAAELLLLKEKGAITFAQDMHSSVVHGMPGEAIRLDAVTYVLSPEKIATVLAGVVVGKSNHAGPE